MKTVFLTAVAMLAFASNSILCRKALGGNTIDAASFTTIRLGSGIVMFMLILLSTQRANLKKSHGSWFSAVMLYLYAIAFSFAYLSLDTGVGALILFASVQITLILASIYSGNRLIAWEWFGFAAAISGFIYLLHPSLTRPTLVGFLLMSIAGVAWGIYTLRGRSSANPLLDTANNFIRTAPFLLVTALFAIPLAHVSSEGAALAIISGALASGLGYTIWYMALTNLSAIEASVVQLSVPIIAAIGGVVWVGESISTRLLISSGLVLGGIVLVVFGRQFSSAR